MDAGAVRVMDGQCNKQRGIVRVGVSPVRQMVNSFVPVNGSTGFGLAFCVPEGESEGGATRPVELRRQRQSHGH